MRKENPDGTPVVFTLHDPKNLDELRAKFKALDDEKRDGRMTSNALYITTPDTNSTGRPSTTVIVKDASSEKKSGFFSKIRSFLKK